MDRAADGWRFAATRSIIKTRLALDLHAVAGHSCRLIQVRIFGRTMMSSPTEGDQGSGSIGEHARAAVEHVSEAASECCSAWNEQCKHLAESAEDYVRKQPIKSLLIATGIGL